MELTSLFLLVLLPPADATGDMATAVTASLRRELGEVSMAIAPDTLVTPAMWQGDKASMHARFVVHLVWKQMDSASIEVFAPTSAKEGAGFRRERELVFAQQDSKTERGRAIGLVVAELLRESPAVALAAAGPAVDKAATEPGTPSRLVLGGRFAMERVRAGNWALGPELTYDFGLGESLRLQASGTALFASADQYSGIGVGIGIFWDFLRSERGRHALGVGLEAGVLHESATVGSSDYASSGSKWSLAVGPSLGGRWTVWRGLRIVGELDLCVTSQPLSVTTGGDDSNKKTTHTFSRWRPAGALGLEVAL
jgi:hypothetical protein